MKLLTCNTHSIVEKDYEEKLSYFNKWLAKEEYDIVALQEVNQTHESKKINIDGLKGYVPSGEGIIIREDNHIMRVVNSLQAQGKEYYWTWTPIKLGYGKYDEGIGIISKHKPKEIREFYLTKSKSYTNWKVRKVIGIKVEIEGKERWFFSVHTGWWDDDEENFKDQLRKLNRELSFVDEDIYLMGDFNNPYQIENEGYDEILNSGWYDTYDLAEEKDDGITVSGLIDGWKENKNLKEMRIDFIFKTNNEKVKRSRVIFNGKVGEIVSDHFAVEVEE
jgi:maltose 6'-phosphate phosphatase